MIQKELEKISEEDLESLIAGEIKEGRTIDYKEQLNIGDFGNADDKKEFLGDVSSFANASGGDLIIGIKEDKGLPISIPGLDTPDTDKEMLRIEQMIRDGIQPRIIGIRLAWVGLKSSRKVLIIRIPRSWNSPHKVAFRGWDKFFGRTSAGKAPMDITELRTAFNLSSSLSEQIRRFRTDRLSAIMSGETPVQFVQTPKIIIHLIPLYSFDYGQSIDLKQIYDASPYPMFVAGTDRRYNFDGILMFRIDSGSNQLCRSYTQFYKKGIIEEVEGALLSIGALASDNGRRYMPLQEFEKMIPEFISEMLKILKHQNVPPPVYIFVTLVGVKGYEAPSGRGMMWFSEARPAKIDRDVLTLPESIVDDYEADVHDLMSNAIDSLWNACGYQSSLTYHDKKNSKSSTKGV